MYEPHYEEESGGGGFVFGLLCGAALGAAVGLMFAPKSGSELRQTLYDSSGDIRKKATDAYGQATQTVNDYVAKGRDAVERGKQAFDSARESATEGYTQARTGGNSGDFSGRPSGVQS
jgi:gas vesicle protein